MTTEEVSKPPSLPSYLEMIFAAVDAVKGQEGANKSSISRYIESTYGDVPAGHTNLLTDNLSKLVDDGELVIVKNNYKRPDPNAPAKRGRGRPPKPKDPSAPEVSDAPPKPRGRPRKDPNAPPPPKKAKPDGTSTPSSTGKPRGRPRKVNPPEAQNVVEAN